MGLVWLAALFPLDLLISTAEYQQHNYESECINAIWSSSEISLQSQWQRRHKSTVWSCEKIISNFNKGCFCFMRSSEAWLSTICFSAGGWDIELHAPSQELKLEGIYGSTALWYLGAIGTMMEWNQRCTIHVPIFPPFFGFVSNILGLYWWHI